MMALAKDVFAERVDALRRAVIELSEKAGHVAELMEEAQEVARGTQAKRLSLAEDVLLEAIASIGSVDGYVEVARRAQ